MQMYGVHEVNYQVLGRAVPTTWNTVELLGPYFVGGVLDFLFLGVLSCQLSTYYSTYRKDALWIRYLVAICTTLSILKAIEGFWLMWEIGIREFGDENVIVTTHWPVYMEPTSMVLLSTSAQTYFAWRCFNLTGRSWALLTFLVPAMLGVVALGVSFSLELALNPHSYPIIQRLGVPMLVLGLVVDTVITGTVLNRLLKSRREVKRSADGFVKSWIAITWQCALPPALSQMANVVAFFIAGKRNLWHGCFNMITPRLYTISLMYALNIRKDFQLGVYAEADNSTSGNGHPEEQIGERKGFERSEIVTLSTFRARQQASPLDTSCSRPSRVMQQDPQQSLAHRCCTEAPDEAPSGGVRDGSRS